LVRALPSQSSTQDWNTIVAKSNEDILKLKTKAQRYLKRTDLLNRYTKEELEELLTYVEIRTFYDDGTEVPPDNILLSDLRYSARFHEQESIAAEAQPRHIRKWAPEEDEFLRTNYMYLSDSVIALALNVPKVVVAARRVTLGLSKEISTSLEVIIWADRDKFDEDIKKFHLTKARPEAFQ